MNEIYVGKLNSVLSDGRKLEIQLVHVPNPQPWELNPSGTTEECVVLREDDKTPLLIRVSSRSPLMLEQIDPSDPKGATFWEWFFRLLKT